MHEVLFTKEIMCATRFSTSRVAHLKMTKHHQTRLCNMEAQTRSMSLRRWLDKLCRFCFHTWHFCEEVVYKVNDKKDGTPFMVVSPDGSLRRSAHGLADIHTNPPLSLEIKCLFHLHKGFQCFRRFKSGISRSVRYMEQMVLQSQGHLLFSVGPRKMVTVECYVSLHLLRI